MAQRFASRSHAGCVTGRAAGISAPGAGPLQQNFPGLELVCNEGTQAQIQSGLKRRGVEWPLGMAVNSIELVETYASRGFGIGLSVAMPDHDLRPAALRALSLSDFPRVPVGLVWKSNPGAALKALIKGKRQASHVFRIANS